MLSQVTTVSTRRATNRFLAQIIYPRTTTKCCQRFSSSGGGNTNTNIAERIKDLRIHPAAGAAALVFGSVLAARLTYGHLIGPNESNRHHGPRRDESKVSVRVSTTTYDRVRLDTSPELTPERLVDATKQSDNATIQTDGRALELKSVDADAFAAFLADQRAKLKMAKDHSAERGAAVLQKELKDALSDAEDRISKFADWYFAYKTTYSLLAIAMASAARHSVTFGSENTLSEAVTEEIQAHVQRKYEALVLRPAVTDAKVHRAFVRSLKAVHTEYMSAVADLETSVSKFVSQEAGEYATPPMKDDVVIEMDWAAQMQKVEHVPLAYEKNPELSLAIIGAGAAAGKAAGGAAVGTAVKVLSAKLSAPFATKAAGATLAKAASVGAAGGGALAGPVGGATGAAAGAAIGLGVDLTVNAGVDLLHRSEFKKDVSSSLEATRMEWEERLLPEVERLNELWFGTAEALLQNSRRICAKDSDATTFEEEGEEGNDAARSIGEAQNNRSND